MKRIDQFAALAPRIVDLSADFRLRHAGAYQQWYGAPHVNPGWLDRFVYGLPELHRDEIRSATYVSGVGCNATATTLAIWPLAAAGVLDAGRGIICEVKVGSSEGGAASSDATHHPERAGVMRSFAPTGHRHTAEVLQALQRAGLETAVHLSATAVDNVRGVLATAHAFTNPGVAERDLWKAYRDAYGSEPFVRLVKERAGLYRYPEPKILSGSNYADVGFELDATSNRVVAMCAIDNLMKGAAGTAVQCANLMCGWDETTGLEFPGLHPV
jgi:N-acetyl-gamma-glutamyl-phosphate/LysW-gamma-L-alpha-aminoadipyl-6-phosphate reductase